MRGNQNPIQYLSVSLSRGVQRTAFETTVKDGIYLYGTYIISCANSDSFTFNIYCSVQIKYIGKISGPLGLISMIADRKSFDFVLS